MDSQRLIPEQIAKIHQFLSDSLRHGGADILGSQLGQFVAKALAPKSIKSLGGIRAIVERDLADAVEFIEPRQSDFLFRIKLKPLEPVHELIEQRAVSGADLWRYFSNPNMRCLLGVDSADRVLVTSLDQPFGSDVRVLNRMGVDEYKALAEAYALEQSEEGFREQLLELVNDSWLYSKWIAYLRAKRSNSINYLKSWEIKRTELVVGRLRETLESAGLEPSQATVVADAVRPVARKKPADGVQPAVDVSERSAQLSPEVGEAKELKELRAFLHQALDYMPLSDLKAIRVPAGVLIELLNKPSD